jgi:hypothetical protein
MKVQVEEGEGEEGPILAAAEEVEEAFYVVTVVARPRP